MHKEIGRVMINTIPEKYARLIWQVLVEECGHKGDERDLEYSFIPYLGQDHSLHEYRFMGALGFGGKFYNLGHKWRVGCYLEDNTAARIEMIHYANSRLDKLKEEFDKEYK